jgi:hypothetical protein
MSLSPLDMLAQTIVGVRSFLIDVYNHLGPENYDNGDWTPVFTGLTGSPVTIATFQRFGKFVQISISVSGTFSFSSGTITGLPIIALGNGALPITKWSDFTCLGAGIIAASGTTMSLPDFSVTSDIVTIQGLYPVEGI